MVVSVILTLMSGHSSLHYKDSTSCCENVKHGTSVMLLDQVDLKIWLYVRSNGSILEKQLVAGSAEDGKWFSLGSKIHHLLDHII